MSIPDKIYPLVMQPGIQRDGTKFASRQWIDGKWVRFYNGFPKKMGGYQKVTGSQNIARGIYVYPQAPDFNVYVGEEDNISFFQINADGEVGARSFRTPAVGFQGSQYNLWTFDTMFSTVDDESVLVAHCAPNLSSIDSQIETPVLFGSSLGTDPLQATGFSTSGGIVVLHPNLFIFGNNGDVRWSEPNNPQLQEGDARVAAQKIVAGYATRGGNSSPAGLLWSLDALIRVTNVGTSETSFMFDTVTNDTSILSSNCVVEYDGVYFWIGIDRFLYYQGVVQELENNTNLEWFFLNLNIQQRQKVWGTKYTKYGEIWWFFPKIGSVECDHALIYNIRDKCWYDTPISRSCGYYEQTFTRPLWADSDISADGLYNVWKHEVKYDENVDGDIRGIESYVESGSLAWAAVGPDSQRNNIDRWVYLYRLEPDFTQVGNMYLIINTRKYARSAIQSSTLTFSSIDSVQWQYVDVSSWEEWGDYLFKADSEKIDLRVQGREMTLKFYSNTAFGNFEMGQVLLVGRIGDGSQ